jgi:ABC-type nitrate/sulfonate/bicarbonate transport system substrate-binding protein
MKKIIILLGLCTILTCCKEAKKEQNQNVLNETKYEASLRFNWLTTCSFAGEVVGAKKFAEKHSLNLRLDEGGIGMDPIKLVQADENTFGLAGADLVLAANDKGADFVIIGLVNYDSPGVWVSKKEKNIKSVDDIKPNTRIGELPGGNIIYLYEVFLKKANLKRNTDFTPVPIPFELKNFIASDECDLRPIFIYEVLPELDMLGIEYNVIEPKDENVSFKGLTYFCKRETIEKNPELVKAFIHTMIDGWTYALANKKQSIELLSEFDNSINQEKELLGLKAGEDYFNGYEEKLLYSDLESWTQMINDMKDLGFLKNDVDLNKVLNLDFVKEYYKNE